MPLMLWDGKLLVVGGELAVSEDCCCATEPTGCQNLVDDVKAIFSAVGCNLDGYEVTIPDISLGFGDEWEDLTIEESAGNCWMSGSIRLECDPDYFDDHPGDPWWAGYRITLLFSSSGGCSTAPTTPVYASGGTLSPFSLTFEGFTITDGGSCEGNCGCGSYPSPFTIEVVRP